MATRLRKRVADILHSEHRVSQTRVRGLSVKDTDQLASIATGARLPEYRIKALNVLAATRDVTAGETFAAALRDTQAPFEVRAAGATWLSRLGGMAAEGELMARLEVEEMPVVQHKIVAGLARVGSEAALRRLGDAVQAADAAVRDHARFAQAVIACRTGIAGFELPPVDESLRLPAPAGAAVAASATAARPEEALRVIEQTAGDNHGVAGDPQAVALVRCGRRQLAIVTHDPPPAADGPARPWLGGYVAVQAEADASYSTGLLALCWPGDGHTVRVSVHRLSGRAEFSGVATVEGDTLRFKLDAVRAPGATETTVEGVLVGGRLVEMQVSSGRTLERMRPTPMEDR
jgi:hypothetical protein